jgi:hypothetical protein
MAIIYPHFLKTILKVHEDINNQMPYPFFDTACVRYEALRFVMVDGGDIQSAFEKYGLTEYAYRRSLSIFHKCGTAGLIGLDSNQLTETIPNEVERMVYVLKKARAWIPATKMVIILKGFNHDISIPLMRHLYASYGWALGTRQYKSIDFWSLNLKVMQLSKLQASFVDRRSFFYDGDQLQTHLEVFRTLGIRGITKRYPGSRV